MLCALLSPLSKYKNWKISRKINMGGQICGIVFVHKTDNQTKVFQFEKKKRMLKEECDKSL